MNFMVYSTKLYLTTFLLGFILIMQTDFASAQYNNSQNNVAVFVGVSLPVGDYSNTSGSVANAGFAETGVCFGFELGNSFHNKLLSGITTISLSINPIDNNSFSEYIKKETGNQITSNLGSYITISALYGVKLETQMSSGVSFYIQ